MIYFKDIKDFNSIFMMKLSSALELSDILYCVVLPGYPNNDCDLPFYLTTYVESKFLILKIDLKGLEIKGRLDVGSKITITKDAEIVTFIKQSELVPLNKSEVIYKQKKSLLKSTSIYRGQSVVLYGYRSEGKTYTAKKIAKHLGVNGFTVFKITFDQSKLDDLGEKTIIFDAQLGFQKQMMMFYQIFDTVVREAHNGINCCVIVDSITSFINSQNLFEKKSIGHVMIFVKQLMSMAGNFNKGSITFITTMARVELNSLNNSICDSLLSHTDCGIWVAKKRNNHNYSKKP